MATEKVILTTLCLLQRNDEILLQNRVKKDWQGVTLPGGHVEKDEPFLVCVKREMKEETGLTILNPTLCGVKQFKTDHDERYIVFLYKADQFSGELCSSDEGEMFWAKRSELDRYPLVADFAKLLRVFDEDSLNEFYYEQAAGSWIPTLY